MNVPNLPTGMPPADLLAVISRAASDPSVDVDRFQRLLDILEAQTQRQSERAFNAALVAAQSEMHPINADAQNPQTRSRYATFAKLHREAHPLYSKHGLAPSYTTEPTGNPNMLRVVMMLAHRDGFTRRYEIDMPIVTKGAKGTEFMNLTHATSSAYSYGRRYLLIGAFNLAIDDDDDDGNAAGRRAPVRPVARGIAPPIQHQRDADEAIDPDTGEVDEYVAPFKIEMAEGSSWAQFLEPLQRYMLRAANTHEFDEWKLLNQDLLIKLKDAKPQLFKLFEKNVEPRMQELM
jgi:hypothetical protein